MQSYSNVYKVIAPCLPVRQDFVYSEDSLSNSVRYPVIHVLIFIKGQRAGCKEPGPSPANQMEGDGLPEWSQK